MLELERFYVKKNEHQAKPNYDSRFCILLSLAVVLALKEIYLFLCVYMCLCVCAWTSAHTAYLYAQCTRVNQLTVYKRSMQLREPDNTKESKCCVIRRIISLLPNLVFSLSSFLSIPLLISIYLKFRKYGTVKCKNYAIARQR